MFNVKLLNKISASGLDRLDATKYTCADEIENYDSSGNYFDSTMPFFSGDCITDDSNIELEAISKLNIDSSFDSLDIIAIPKAPIK